MENNLIIENIYASYEGEFNPAFIKRNEKRKHDGFCYVLKGKADYLFKNVTISVQEGDVIVTDCVLPAEDAEDKRVR